MRCSVDAPGCFETGATAVETLPDAVESASDAVETGTTAVDTLPDAVDTVADAVDTVSDAVETRPAATVCLYFGMVALDASLTMRRSYGCKLIQRISTSCLRSHWGLVL